MQYIAWRLMPSTGSGGPVRHSLGEGGACRAIVLTAVEMLFDMNGKEYWKMPVSAKEIGAGGFWPMICEQKMRNKVEFQIRIVLAHFAVVLTRFRSGKLHLVSPYITYLSLMRAKAGVKKAIARRRGVC